MSVLNVVVLAAGQGKRMYSNLAKVLHKLAGKPLLQHVMDSANALNPSKLCVIYGHGGDAVPNAFPECAVTWVKQEPQLGTGHAVQQAIPHLNNDGLTLILYGDVPLTTTATLKQLTDAAGAGQVAVLTIALAGPAGYGRILRDGGGRITGIVEHKDATPQQRDIREVNTGIMAVPTKQLARWLSQLKNDNAQHEYYLTDIIAMAVAENVNVVAVHPSGEWETLGINNKVQLAQLERTHQANIARALMEQGVTLADPARIDVRGVLTCGKDVFIDINCIFEGNVSLGDNVTVGAGAVVKNVSIANDTQIAPYSVLEDAVIGPDCRIGPYARVRPGTKLAAGAHIGNFVEIKNSEIGKHSKANHLAYIGDATVGQNVNIGAGTITCNYDGANKHRTIIEDDAFIGSDTQLVAPVRIGKGATLGAGTTLSKDAPAGELTISRAKQTTVPGWKRPTKISKK
ncbi:MAG: bifunctional UDP-N-acetylglucosamine diphosphorylase/glucosamine-1-phosphate N-acetyltransferase GlmU [Burkholderiales bacterium]